MDVIYLDNNATTFLLPAVWDAMRPFYLGQEGNPASNHRFGRHARQALEEARERIAHLIDADPAGVIFTSGATEANNLAVFGLAPPAPGHLISTPLEHPCVAEPLRQLAARGYTQTLLPVNRAGTVTFDAACLQPDTRLTAIMLANHETGAVQPVEAIAAELAGRVPIHCDAAAAAGKMPISFRALGVTALTLSAHKFHGPAGIGALVLKKGARLNPLFWGGHQQQGKRPGTEPVALAVGMAAALEMAVREMEVNRTKVLSLRQAFLEKLKAEAAPIVVNGPDKGGLPHTLNVSFPGCAADVLFMKLDLVGVACSTGSACSSGSLLPSPVLKAMGAPSDVLHSALRFSFSPALDGGDVVEAAQRIINAVNSLRQKKSSAAEE